MWSCLHFEKRSPYYAPINVSPHPGQGGEFSLFGMPRGRDIESLKCACAIRIEEKKHILNSDFKILLSSATQRCGSAAAAACVATHTSWRRLWDVALDQGVKGTRIMQAIFKELCRPSSCFQCSLCDSVVPSNSSCLEHACTNHPSEMENLSYNHLISLLINADSAVSIFSSCKRVSYSSCFWTLKHSN